MKIFFVALLFIVTACEKQTEWDLQTKPPGLICVEGILTNEYKAHQIRLTYPVTALNATPVAVSGATVTISDGHTTYALKESPPGYGIYRTDSTVKGVTGRQYTLTISSLGKTYTATTTMVPCTPFWPLSYSKKPNGNRYKIDWVAEKFDSNSPAMYEIIIDWSHLPRALRDSTDSTGTYRRKLYYFTLPTLDVSQVFAPEKEEVIFPAGAIITERKYSLTPKHVEYLRAVLCETEWKGGYFDSAPANVTGNLSAGALGFFGASTVISATINVVPY